MKLLSVVTALAGAVVAVPAPSLSNDKGLEVSLELVGGTDVKATVKNSGSEQIRILKTASIIGDAPSKKVQVTSEGP
jgi:deuterolysin